MADQPGSERGGDHAAHEQCAGDPEVDALAAQREEEADRSGHGDHELRSVDGADHLARLQPAGGEQRGGADRAPAPAADRVGHAGDQPQGREEPDGEPAPELRAPAAEGQEAPQDVTTQREQQSGHPRLGRVAVQAGQEGGTGEGPHRARHGDDRDRAPVDVAQPVVGEARHRRGADLGEVDRRRRRRGSHPGAEQQRRGRDPVGHAEGAVDELGEQPDHAEDEEVAHGEAFLPLHRVSQVSYLFQ